MAQETKLKRKDLKEPDQFLVASNEFLDFLTRNKSPTDWFADRSIRSGGGIFIRGSTRRARKVLEMETVYFQMTQLVEDENGPAGEQLISKLKSLVEQFEEGDQKLRAQLFLGGCSISK